ncbi:hypothetical protein BH11ACT5_BH11ACT5_02630 [soil metagenome]
MTTVLAQPSPQESRPTRRASFLDGQSTLDSLLSTQRGGVLPTPTKPYEQHSKWELRQQQRAGSSHPTVRKCGYNWRCNNEFLCPFCTMRMLCHDRTAIKGVLRFAPTAEFATLTMAHTLDGLLDEQWSILNRAWARMTKGKAWDTFRARFAVSGYVRSFDCTWSPRTGWHPHWHVILVSRIELNPTELAQLRARLGSQWTRALAAVGGDAGESAQLSEPVRNADAVAAYMTTDGPFKHSDPDSYSYTPLDLLHAATSGDKSAWMLWTEYEDASRGQRAVTLAGVFATENRRTASAVRFV